MAVRCFLSGIEGIHQRNRRDHSQTGDGKARSWRALKKSEAASIGGLIILGWRFDALYLEVEVVANEFIPHLGRLAFIADKDFFTVIIE